MKNDAIPEISYRVAAFDECSIAEHSPDDSQYGGLAVPWRIGAKSDVR